MTINPLGSSKCHRDSLNSRTSHITILTETLCHCY